MNTEFSMEQTSLLGTLGINWKIFLAQLINFGIVLFVMWKWVYTPLLKAIEERQKKTEKGLKDADEAARNLAHAAREYETTVTSARREAQRILEEAAAAAEKTRAGSTAKAQQEVAKVVAEGRARLADEKEQIVRQAKKEIAELAVAIAEKAVNETMGDKQQKTLLESAVKRFSA